MTDPRNACPYSLHGFSLVEMAVVLVILSLILAGVLGPLRTQLEARGIQKTRDHLQQIADAILGYAVANGRLPCPDTDTAINNAGYGISEDLEAPPAACVAQGFVPGATLGVDQLDAWGNRIRYRITTGDFLVAENGNGCAASDGNLDLCDDGNIIIQSRRANKATLDLTNTAPAVLVSNGPNKSGARRGDGAVLPLDPLSGADETQNANNNTLTFRSRDYTPGQNGCSDSVVGTAFCAFDDVVVWISPYVLKARMVQAGRLP